MQRIDKTSFNSMYSRGQWPFAINVEASRLSTEIKIRKLMIELGVSFQKVYKPEDPSALLIPVFTISKNIYQR